MFSVLGHRPRSGAAESLGFTVLFLRMFDIMGIFQPFLARKPYFHKASQKTLEKSDLAHPLILGNRKPRQIQRPVEITQEVRREAITGNQKRYVTI